MTDEPQPKARTWSRPAEDLSREPLLRHAAPIEFDTGARPSIGRRIAVLSKLGRGGMGVVYHGVHVRLGAEVAVKLLPLQLQGHDEELVSRFEREAQIAARLRSPHLVEVIDIDLDDATRCHFIVMEYVAGASADRVLARRPGGLREIDALDLCVAATEGLDVAHMEGVVHRDIKPSNILVPGHEDAPSFGDSKLADLGLARRVDSSEDPTLTASHVPVGTPGYMAPEQTVDARHAKKPADVFGMGATLFALLEGHAPYQGADLIERLQNTRAGRRASLRERRPDVTEATQTLIERCLELDPANRFADASALLVALRLCREAAVAVANGAHDSLAPTRVAELTRQPERGKRVVTPSPTRDATTPAMQSETAPAASPPPLSTANAAEASEAAQKTVATPPRRSGRRTAAIVAACVVSGLVATYLIASPVFRGGDGASAKSSPPANSPPPATSPVPRTEASVASSAPAAAPTEKPAAEPRPPLPTAKDGGRGSVDAPHAQEAALGTLEPTADLAALGARFLTAQRAGDETLMAALGSSIAPTKTDVLAMLTKGPAVDAFVAALAARGLGDPAAAAELGRTLFAPGDAARTEIRAYASTTEQLAAYADGTTAFDHFPGGMRQFAAIAAPGRTWYVVKITAPGARLGMSYAAFTKIGDRWVFLGKPWRAMAKEEAPAPAPAPAPPPTVAPKPTTGSIVCPDLPAGTTSFVDDRPYRPGDPLAPGEHAVRLERPGYRAQRGRLSVSAGENSTIHLDRWMPLGPRIAWTQGSQFTLETGETSEAHVKGPAGAAVVNTTRSALTELVVDSVDDDGVATVRARCDRATGTRTENDRSTGYDSDKGTGEPDDVAVVGHWILAKVGADGAVTGVSVPDGWRKPRNGGAAFSDADTARALANHLQNFFPRYVSGKSEPGDAWSTSDSVFDDGLVYDLAADWRVESKSDDESKLAYDAKGVQKSGAIAGMEGWRLESYAESGKFLVDLPSGLPRSHVAKSTYALVAGDVGRQDATGVTAARWTPGPPSKRPAGPSVLDALRPPPTQRSAPAPAAPPSLSGVYAGTISDYQQPDGTYRLGLPSGWAAVSANPGVALFNPGLKGGPFDDCSTIALVIELSETAKSQPVERLLEAEVAEFQQGRVPFGKAQVTSVTSPVRRVSLGGDEVGAECSCDGSSSGNLVSGWIGARVAHGRVLFVIAVEPRSKNPDIVPGAKRMLWTARLNAPGAAAPPVAGVDASALAGRRFGHEFFYGTSGSSTEIYQFFANGTVTVESMTSAGVAGDANSTKRGRWQIVGGSVQITYSDGRREVARVQRGANGELEGIQIGSAAYRLLK